MSVLSATSQKQIESQIIKEGLISSDDLEKHRKAAEKLKTTLFAYITTQKLINSEDIVRITNLIANVPYVNLLNARIEPKVLSLIPLDLAERYMSVPLGEMDGKLVVAMLDASNLQASDFLANKIGRQVKVYSASEDGIRHVLEQYQTDVSKEVTGVLGSSGIDEVKTRNVIEIKQDSPISKALNSILEYAGRNRASDIHIEPLEKELQIRCRIDGILKTVMVLPKNIEAPLVSRIKILSNLKIDEHRIPQDGQFSVKVADKEIDLRIAIAPIVWGEQVVIRLLDKSGTSLKLEQMGYTGRALRLLHEGTKKPNGMILTSGPTGSGKSTSLYALIQEIKSEAINIVTLEDPVEYKMDGINQMQVNADVGLTFASGLRSILRQDPNVVMVGEIRDKETATLAVQAALTGHLVLSTLHTNSAAGILPRLLDMGIEPFLIASTVHTVIGQRLVRRLDKGAEAYTSDAKETETIHQMLGHLLPQTEADIHKVSSDLGYNNLPLANQNAYTLFRPTEGQPGSATGYKGRMGLYEVFSITQEIQDLILKRSTSAEINRQAIEQGMVTMRQDGYLKALAGLTTIQEVNRVAMDDM